MTEEVQVFTKPVNKMKAKFVGILWVAKCHERSMQLGTEDALLPCLMGSPHETEWRPVYGEWVMDNG